MQGNQPDAPAGHGLWMEMEGVPDGEVAGMPRRPVRAAAQTLLLLLDLDNPDWG
jgi:hypothetical protein